MYNHILIPTDGSELSNMAIYEGVALAKALGARVTVVTVTTPFRVFTADPTMITDTPDQYKEHMAAVAGQYLDVAKKIAKAAGLTCDLVHLEHDQPYQAIIDTAQNRACDAIQMASHGRRGISAMFARQRNPQGADAQRHPRHRVSSAEPGDPQGFICRIVKCWAMNASAGRIS